MKALICIFVSVSQPHSTSLNLYFSLNLSLVLSTSRSLNLSFSLIAVLGKFHEVIMGADSVSQEKIIDLLLNTSDLEYKLKAIFQHLLDTKEDRYSSTLTLQLLHINSNTSTLTLQL